jgi:hypothetical protein
MVYPPSLTRLGFVSESVDYVWVVFSVGRGATMAYFLYGGIIGESFTFRVLLLCTA